MSELSIKLKIADREYPLRVSSEDEEAIREAAKKLNKRIKVYKEKYGISDYQDLMAMVAFDCLVEDEKKAKDTSDDHMLEQVKGLNKMISKVL
ncbi:MAG: cell division protein ZapA [Cyclobacteriaceae bacterium]|nr:cell division protein ZapA [Cyclobacteriaceae bacterium]MCH8515639.1 cell division protein ZapA [Cyclobacteriaceae bacterium]